MPAVSLPRLLATAKQLCDRTEATEQERANWHADIEAALPEHRTDLLALVQSLMPKAQTVQATEAPSVTLAPTPMSKFHLDQAWRETDKAVQTHYWQCDTCKAAARSGHSDRCAVGQHLHQLYEQAAMPKEST